MSNKVTLCIDCDDEPAYAPATVGHNCQAVRLKRSIEMYKSGGVVVKEQRKEAFKESQLSLL